MAQLSEGENGMSYDFGVAIARGTVQSLAATTAGVVALTGAIVGIVKANTFFEETLNKNVVAFGGYANTLKAITFANDKMMSGGGFDVEDQLAGMKQLQRAGLNARKEFELVSEAATATSSSFNDVAGIIRSGDFHGLAEMGLITDRTAKSMENMGYNAKMATGEVIKLLKEAKGKGLFEGAVPTMAAILKRFAAFKNEFVMAVIGDPKDPEGLSFNIKKMMNMTANFIQKHRDKIIFAGKAIGMVLKTVAHIVGDFAKRVFGFIGKMIGAREKSQAEMKDQLMSFQLWLAIIREKINTFFDKYGSLMAAALKWFVLFKAASAALNIGKWAIKGVKDYFMLLKGGIKDYISKGKDLIDMGKKFGTGIGELASSFMKIVPMAWEFTAAMLANPIGLIVLAVLALGAAIYLVVKYWDDIYSSMQGVSDGFIAMVGIFMPVLGLVLLFMKYWEEVKATILNMWEAVKAKAIEIYLNILQLWVDFKNFFIEMWNSFTGIVSAVWEAISTTFYEWFGPIIDFMANLFTPLIEGAKMAWDWIYETLIKPFSDFFSSIGDMFSGIFGKAVDSSADMAKNAQASSRQSIDDKVKSGLITQAEGDNLKAMMDPSGIKTNADVQEIKKTELKRIEDKKAGKSADTNPTIEQVHASMPSVDRKYSNADFNGAGGTTVENINVTVNGSNLSPMELEKAITKAIEKMNLKQGMRTGKN